MENSRKNAGGDSSVSNRMVREGLADISAGL